MRPQRFRALETTTVLDREVPVATSVLSRLMGLALLDRPHAGEGLLIPDCGSVHTFGMRFSLDVIFLDAGRGPIEARLRVPARRILVCRRAVAVLELPSR